VATRQDSSSDGATEGACAELEGERWISGAPTTEQASTLDAEQVTPSTDATG
jgi:hypothetical protein